MEMKSRIETDQFWENVEADLDEMCSQIRTHYADFEEIEDLCQVGNINALYINDVHIFMNEMEHEIENFKYYFSYCIFKLLIDVRAPLESQNLGWGNLL